MFFFISAGVVVVVVVVVVRSGGPRRVLSSHPALGFVFPPAPSMHRSGAAPGPRPSLCRAVGGSFPFVGFAARPRRSVVYGGGDTAACCPIFGLRQKKGRAVTRRRAARRRVPLHKRLLCDGAKLGPGGVCRPGFRCIVLVLKRTDAHFYNQTQRDNTH